MAEGHTEHPASRYVKVEKAWWWYLLTEYKLQQFEANISCKSAVKIAEKAAPGSNPDGAQKRYLDLFERFSCLQ